MNTIVVSAINHRIQPLFSGNWTLSWGPILYIHHGFVWCFIFPGGKGFDPAIPSSTLQILEKYVFSEFDLYRLILPKTPRSWILGLWLHVFGFGETKAKKCLQRIKRLGIKPAKPRKKPAKSPQKPAKTRKSWNLVVLGSFRIFLVVPKIITVCVPGRSAEIFPETYMFGTKWIIFWFVWPIFLERPFFPRQWRVEDAIPSHGFLSVLPHTRWSRSCSRSGPAHWRECSAPWCAPALLRPECWGKVWYCLQKRWQTYWKIGEHMKTKTWGSFHDERKKQVFVQLVSHIVMLTYWGSWWQSLNWGWLLSIEDNQQVSWVDNSIYRVNR